MCKTTKYIMGVCCGLSQNYDPPGQRRVRDTQSPLLSNSDRKPDTDLNAKIELQSSDSLSNNSYSASISPKREVKHENNQTEISKYNSLSSSKKEKASIQETVEIQVKLHSTSTKTVSTSNNTSNNTSNKKQSSETNGNIAQYSIPSTDTNNEIILSSNMDKNNTKITLKTEEKELKSNEDSKEPSSDLPQTISVIPIESTIKMDEIDLEFYHKLQERYASELAKYKVGEYFLRRFIFGYNNIPKKQRMQSMIDVIDKYFVFHEEYDMDNIAETHSTKEEFDVWQNYIYGICTVSIHVLLYMYTMHVSIGEDKSGHPVLYDMIACSDPKLMAKTFGDNGTSDPVTHIMRTFRKISNYEQQNSVKYGYIIHKHIQVFDVKDMGMGHLTGESKKTSQRVVGLLTDFFPETAHTLYIINSPKIFRVAWRIISKFMDPVTVAKTKILGKKFLKEMLKEIDISMIPKKYGGTGKWEIQMGDLPKGYPIDPRYGID